LGHHAVEDHADQVESVPAETIGLTVLSPPVRLRSPQAKPDGSGYHGDCHCRFRQESWQS
jgi:hypothetical protein